MSKIRSFATCILQNANVYCVGKQSISVDADQSSVVNNKGKPSDFNK